MNYQPETNLPIQGVEGPLQDLRPQRTQIMTIHEAAKYLGVHEVTIYRLLRSTDIPAIKLGGQWRFKKDILDRWLLEKMGRRSGIARSRRSKAAASPDNKPHINR